MSVWIMIRVGGDMGVRGGLVNERGGLMILGGYLEGVRGGG